MNKNMIIVLGGALFVAILAALLVQSGLSSGDKEPQEVVEKDTVEVLVAARDIGVGVELGQANLTWKDWPKENAFSGAIVRQNEQDAADALSGRALRPIDQGEPIIRASIVKETRGNFVAASLEPGMRAFAIRVSAETAVGGFVSPGDYVDVIMTHRVKLPTDREEKKLASRIVSETASETIVQAVKVLGVDQEKKPTDEASKFRTITLQVSPKQAEKIALGAAMGDLSVSLRKIGDTTPTQQEQKAFVTDNETSRVMREIMGSVDSPGTTGEPEVRVYMGNQPMNIKVRPSSP